MSNKFNGFTVPSNMNPTVEQGNTKTLPAERSDFSVEGLKDIEGGVNTQRVEAEQTETVLKSKPFISQDPSPQSYSSGIQRNPVEAKGGVSVTKENPFFSSLNSKSGGNFSVDIRTFSNN